MKLGIDVSTELAVLIKGDNGDYIHDEIWIKV